MIISTRVPPSIPPEPFGEQRHVEDHETRSAALTASRVPACRCGTPTLVHDGIELPFRGDVAAESFGGAAMPDIFATRRQIADATTVSPVVTFAELELLLNRNASCRVDFRRTNG